MYYYCCCLDFLHNGGYQPAQPRWCGTRGQAGAPGIQCPMAVDLSSCDQCFGSGSGFFDDPDKDFTNPDPDPSIKKQRDVNDVFD